MKKDRTFELLTELRDRQFSLNKCIRLFADIEDFFDAIDGRAINDNQNLAGYWSNKVNAAKYRLSDTLKAFGLDYSTDEFITFD